MASRPIRRKLGFEENAIAFLLGAMTLITFANVFVRKFFNVPLAFQFEAATGLKLPHEILWAQEVTLYIFAWLVIFGISHTFRITANLGVDAVIGALPPRGRFALGLVSAACCLVYGLLLLKGAWDYWAPFAGLYETTGRWFPTGFNWSTRDRAFYVTDQVPMPDFLQFLSAWINQGEAWDKMPRVIPYLILPLGMALILLRLVQATLGLLRGTRTSLIVSHEAEDEVRDVAHINREE
ncbi:TRAP transporter small permease [Acidimangrovimonas sediminis]|uniref:TRAP transporter small permease n=1 Tax=Acidimangrovimonas sediminis TaxID=2056283 RepID=UPI000C80E27D|nr:TRAP transporter small permease [Acidimangrovimonas sediminis]